MQREIFEVDAKVVDANGTYNTLTGYPKSFDSRNYQNDVDKTYKRAEGEWHAAMSAFSTRDDRKLQVAYLTRMSDGIQVLTGKYGDMPEVPEE